MQKRTGAMSEVQKTSHNVLPLVLLRRLFQQLLGRCSGQTRSPCIRLCACADSGVSLSLGPRAKMLAGLALPGYPGEVLRRRPPQQNCQNCWSRLCRWIRFCSRYGRDMRTNSTKVSQRVTHTNRLSGLSEGYLGESTSLGFSCSSSALPSLTAK